MSDHNITTAGDMDVKEGVYGKISSAGDLRIIGKIKAEKIKSAGDIIANEEVEVENMTIFGDGLFKKLLKASEVSTFGDLESQNTIDVKVLKVFGGVKGKIFNAEKFTVNGDIEAADEINSDFLEINGAVRVEGSMNIGTGNFNLMGNSKVNEIFCQDLRVNAGNSNYTGILSGLISSNHNGKLVVELIEGDEIFLENAICDIVRGKNIKIGRGSKIRRVEYQNTLKIYENGEVTEKEEF
ncbi:MAG: hypothetical protein WBI17_12355 [Clostridiaceae bacterium]